LTFYRFGGRDHAEVRAIDGIARVVELGMVGDVERFGSELHVDAFRDAELAEETAI
jgi:hypothetical protein